MRKLTALCMASSALWIASCGHPEDLANSAHNAFIEEDYSLAIKYASRALSNDPRSDSMLALRAKSHLELHEYEMAKPDIELLLDRTVDSALYVYLGDCFGGLDSLTAALRAYDAALTYNDELPQAYLGRASVHRKMGNCHLAVPDYERFFELQGSDYIALNALGLCYQESGEMDKARRCFELSVGLDAMNWIAYHNLAGLAYASADTMKGLQYNWIALGFSEDRYHGLLLRERGKMLYHTEGRDSACYLWNRAKHAGDKEAFELYKKHCEHR